MCRWLATAEKKSLFRRELANDIRWLNKEGREKELRVDLPVKFEYLWWVSSGGLLAQNELFRLQHIMHAIMLTGINYGVLNESEWEGCRAVKFSPKIPDGFIRKADLKIGFDKDERQVRPLAVRITAKTSAVDALLSHVGWK